MKICVSVVLLMLLCPGGCPVYDFDLRTIEQPSQFANGLKLAADLNSEYNQGLMNFHVLKDQDPLAADNTCKLIKDLPAEHVESPTRKLKYLRRVEDDEQSSMEVNDFVGSNLFDSTRKNCFSPEDLTLLAARRDFEYLVPKDLPKCLLDDDMLNMLLNYFYNGNELIQRMTDSSKMVIERAYYDMLGGYLRSYMLPVAKYSYYGGKTSLNVVSSVVELYQQCKSFLNTNGNGWRMPILLEELENTRVDPIRGSDCGGDGNGGGSGSSGCARLEMLPANDGDENVMLVALPKFDDDCIENGLSNVWLPFRKKRNYDLRSPKSAYILIRFYETVTRCYQSQSMPQDAFNSKFIAWINENIKPSLSDEEFYPGLGGVLRIVEKLRKGRKAQDPENDQALNEHMEEIGISRVGDATGMGDGKSDDGFSDMELAQKALEYKVKENAKQTMINSKRWFEKNANENRQLQSRKICEKPKHPQGQQGQQNQTNKPKKPKCKKTKGGKHGSSASFLKLTPEEQKHYLKYLCCIIGLILLILLIILLLAMILRYLRRKRKTEPKARPPKKKRKFPAWCNYLMCRKKPADEEIEIRHDTKSVVATQPHRRASTSTSSLACQPTAKCIPCSKRATKESDSAPIIETTSLDYYSSSEPESKVRQKAKRGKQKVVTIDEKKKKKTGSPSPTKGKAAATKSKAASPKSRLSGGAELKSSSSSDSNKRLGIQRTVMTDIKKSSSEMELAQQQERSTSMERSKGSRSWETMYDT
ncbi:unnamed protein product [Ceratitis capitata]|uniref:(Mediterranean fruit fly) hypothetical protein n=1 Tax=Ceratitis capitata TaxID=7213 RepID=A0A811U5U7_CERCA|nr:unnamed protein product [Ceratitis capitata]